MADSSLKRIWLAKYHAANRPANSVALMEIEADTEGEAERAFAAMPERLFGDWLVSVTNDPEVILAARTVGLSRPVGAPPKVTAEQMRKQRVDNLRFDDLPTVGPKVDDRAETRVRADELDLAHYGRLAQVEGHVRYDQFVNDRELHSDPGAHKTRVWNVTGLLMGWRYKPTENLIELQIQQGNHNVHVYVTDDRTVVFA